MASDTTKKTSKSQSSANASGRSSRTASGSSGSSKAGKAKTTAKNTSRSQSSGSGKNKAGKSSARTSGTNVKKTNAAGRSSGKDISYSKEEIAKQSGMYDEVKMIISLAVSIILLVSTLGFGGKLGGYVNTFLFGMFGWLAYILPYLLFFGTAFLLSNRRSRLVWKKVWAFILFAVCLLAFFQMVVSPFDAATKITDYYKDCSVYKNGGGMIGGTVCHFLVPMIGKICTYVILIIGMMLGIVFMAQRAVFTVMLEKIKEWADENREYRSERKRIAEQIRQEEYEAREAAGAWDDETVYEDDAVYERQSGGIRSKTARTRAEKSPEKVSRVKDGTFKLPPREIFMSSDDDGYENMQSLPEDFKLADVDFEEPAEPEISDHKKKLEYSDDKSDKVEADRAEADSTIEYEDEILTSETSDMPEIPEITVTRMTPITMDEVSEDESVSFEGMDDGSKTTFDSDIYELQNSVGEKTEVLDEETVRAAKEAYDRMNAEEADEDDADIISEQIPENAISSNTFDLDESDFEEPPSYENHDLNQHRDEMSAVPESTDAIITSQSTTAQNTASDAATQGTPVMPVKKATPAETQPVTKEEIIEPVKEYVFPPLDLLKRGKPNASTVSDSDLKETAVKLQHTLDSFGVRVQVTNVSCGPSVTRYELTPDQGVKVSKIVALSDDIKLNLAVSDIRIEAPIPGKSAVGIEVPNKENTTVVFRNLIESAEFKQSKSKLSFAVGQDIGGQVIVSDIAKMPHLLIAGATGSGKSVCINTIIMSIIYKSKPEDVRMIMIDPKVVELSVYNGIPHLLIPVVTDPKKAAGALNWAVTEMTDRYNKFAELGVRDMKGYNQKIDSSEYESETYKRMPQIVIIVDELADLMMVSSSEVEDAICRLAQLARAAGIHLVIATQRPSVNVITGIIKANIPSRIAFAVSSGVDSRTIIDMNGAEKLLGKGDMLFYPAGMPKPVRVQGAFVTDQEVSDVVEFLKQENAENAYSAEIEDKIASAKTVDGGSGGTPERDVYFADAGRFIIEKDKASIGMLQRVYKIGFNRAARIMDQLADAGVVGPEEGTKPRKILMSPEEFEAFVENYV